MMQFKPNPKDKNKYMNIIISGKENKKLENKPKTKIVLYFDN